MAKKIRKQIYIEARQEELLKQLVKETGATEAELIRQAIDRYAGSFSPQCDVHAWQEERAFIERLMREGPVPGGRTWTATIYTSNQIGPDSHAMSGQCV